MVLPVELGIEDVKVDPEFRDLCPKLMPEEYDQLRKNLEAEGCRDAIIVWGEENLVVDGHNRLTLCKEKGIVARIVRTDLAEPRGGSRVDRRQPGRQAQRDGEVVELPPWQALPRRAIDARRAPGKRTK